MKLKNATWRAEAVAHASAKTLSARKNMVLRGLEVKHPGFTKAFAVQSKSAVRAVKNKRRFPCSTGRRRRGLPRFLLPKNNPELVGEIPAMEALIDRALELDESFYATAHPSAVFDLVRNEPAGFDRRCDVARASTFRSGRGVVARKGCVPHFVALAEAVTIQKQDVKEFESLLHRARCDQS